MIIQNIWAIGRNYAEHAQELGNKVPSQPLVFLKAGSSHIHSQEEIHLPPFSQDIHHEVELGLRFDNSLNIFEVCVALDLTARDIQNELKTKGSPWTLAKSFKDSCPIGNFASLSNIEDLQKMELRLSINGELKQHGFTKDMIFNSVTLVEYVKARFPVVGGDLLLTGTPSGVGPIRSGDRLVAELLLDGKVLSRGEWITR